MIKPKDHKMIKEKEQAGSNNVQRNVNTVLINNSGNTSISETENPNLKQVLSNNNNNSTTTNEPITSEPTTDSLEPPEQANTTKPKKNVMPKDVDIILRDGSQLSDSSIDAHLDQDVFNGIDSVAKSKSVNIAKIGNGGNSRVSIIKNVQGNVSTDEIIDN